LAGLPRLGGTACQLSKEKEVTGIILTNGTPLAYEVNFMKVGGITDNHILFISMSNHKAETHPKVDR
jgi:hypothetical protein